jgi:hypothetical protein
MRFTYVMLDGTKLNWDQYIEYTEAQYDESGKRKQYDDYTPDWMDAIIALCDDMGDFLAD